jgi:exoribonuclease-2
MERYWCLRWLQQEGVQRIGAAVVKDDLLRLDGLPMLTRLPGLPALPRGQRIEIVLLGSDEIELALHARLHQVLGEAAPLDDEELADEPAVALEGAALADASAADAPPAAAERAEQSPPTP